MLQFIVDYSPCKPSTNPPIARSEISTILKTTKKLTFITPLWCRTLGDFSVLCVVRACRYFRGAFSVRHLPDYTHNAEVLSECLVTLSSRLDHAVTVSYGQQISTNDNLNPDVDIGQARITRTVGSPEFCP